MKRFLLILLCMAALGPVAATAEGATAAPASGRSALPASVQAKIDSAKAGKPSSAKARKRAAARGRALLRAKQGAAFGKPFNLSRGPKVKSGKGSQVRASYHCFYDYCGWAYLGNGIWGDFYHGGYASGDAWYYVVLNYYGYYYGEYWIYWDVFWPNYYWYGPYYY